MFFSPVVVYVAVTYFQQGSRVVMLTISEVPDKKSLENPFSHLIDW